MKQLGEEKLFDAVGKVKFRTETLLKNSESSMISMSTVQIQAYLKDLDSRILHGK